MTARVMWDDKDKSRSRMPGDPWPETAAEYAVRAGAFVAEVCCCGEMNGGDTQEQFVTEAAARAWIQERVNEEVETGRGYWRPNGDFISFNPYPKGMDDGD